MEKLLVTQVIAFTLLIIALLIVPSKAQCATSFTFKILAGITIFLFVLLEPITALLLGLAMAILLFKVHQDSIQSSIQDETFKNMDLIATGGCMRDHEHETSQPDSLPMQPMHRLKKDTEDDFITEEWLKRAQDNTITGASTGMLTIVPGANKDIQGFPSSFTEIW